MNKIFGLFAAGAAALALVSCSETGTVDADELAAMEEKVQSIEGNYIGLVDWGSITNSSGVSISNNIITITAGGTYTLLGDLSDGQIIVESDATTTLILDGVTINNDENAAIYIVDADLTTITLADGSYNKLSDGESYEYTAEGVNATLYSKDTLVINGNGTLEIDANYNDAIISKDSLVIESGNYVINSYGDAIYGKDDLTINGGTFNISTGGGSALVDMNTDEGSIGGPGGGKPRSMSYDTTGLFDWITGSDSSTTDETSSKGIKSKGLITINDGTFSMDTYDDAIHSDDSIIINNGNYDIKAGDDGIHADVALTILDGNIDISYCYEGIESNYITINGGTTSVVSHDDGVNAPTLDDGTKGTIEINEGSLQVVASGDGLDSNGSLYMNGGIVYVEGSSNGGNGALDYDNNAYVTGGTILATGNSQMAQGFSSSSSQPYYMGTFSSTVSSGAVVTIKTASGVELMSTTVTNSFNSIVFSSENVESGSSFIIVVNGTETSKTM